MLTWDNEIIFAAFGKCSTWRCSKTRLFSFPDQGLRLLSCRTENRLSEVLNTCVVGMQKFELNIGTAFSCNSFLAINFSPFSHSVLLDSVRKQINICFCVNACNCNHWKCIKNLVRNLPQCMHFILFHFIHFALFHFTLFHFVLLHFAFLTLFHFISL